MIMQQREAIGMMKVMKISTFIDCLHKEQVIRICNLESKVLYEGKKGNCPGEIQTHQIIPGTVSPGMDEELIVLVK